MTPGARRTLRVGCPMWAHPPWVGRFLSPQRRGSELDEYARWCNTVEGNTTFYAEPSDATVRRWVDQAPSHFRFAFKLPRTITHERRLVGAEQALASFLDRLEPLADRCGPFHVQLPPTFAPAAIRTAESFFRSLPRDRAWVVEFRHPGFFDGLAADRIDDVLGELGIGRVVLDTRPLYSQPPRSDASLDERRAKPRLPERTTVLGAHPMIRVIGADDLDATRSGLDAWADELVDWLDDGLEPYVFVHQPENLDSPALARAVHDVVRSRVESRGRPWTLDVLPTPLPVAPRTEVAGQDSLF